MKYRFISLFVIVLFLIVLTACGSVSKESVIICTKSDNESYQYDDLLGTTYTLRGIFNEEGNITNYYMQTLMKYDKSIDSETFNEYVLENEENVSMFDTSNKHIKYQTASDQSNKAISYSMTVIDIDETFGKSGEIFSPSMYEMEGFKDSLEKNGYTCESNKK